MDTTHIPGPFDAELLLEAAAGVTQTADYDGASLDQGAGFSPGGVGLPAAAVVQVTDLDLTDTDETYAFVLEESDDNVTFSAAGASVAVTATGALSVPGFVSKRYVRVRLDVEGTTPSITYKAHFVPLSSHVG